MTGKPTMTIQVTNVDPEDFDLVKEVAARFGHTSPPSVLRFAFQQFSAGRSLADLRELLRSGAKRKAS